MGVDFQGEQGFPYWGDGVGLPPLPKTFAHPHTWKNFPTPVDSPHQILILPSKVNAPNK